MNMKDKRLYGRLNAKNLNVRGKMVLANYLEIIDMSLNGLSIETDKKLNVGKEYILRVEYEGKIWPIKGYIVWSMLKECKSNGKGNTIPIYVAGMELTIGSNEMREIIKFIELKQKRGEKREYSSLSLEQNCA